MRHFLVRTLAGSSLLLFSLTASGQYPPRSDYRYQDRAEQSNRGWFLNRLQSHLDRAQASALPFTGDRYRISRARQEVSELQRSLAAGDSDRRELDEAIRALQNVLDDNRLSDRNRYLLAGDLNRMRDFGTNHRTWR